MSNAHLISSMGHVLDDFEAGHLSLQQIELAIEHHVQGVEGIRLTLIHETRNLTSRLVEAYMFAGEEEFIGVEEVSQVLNEFRQFLRSLPDQADGTRS